MKGNSSKHISLGIKFVIFGKKNWHEPSTESGTGRFAVTGFIGKTTIKGGEEKVTSTWVLTTGTNKHRCQVTNAQCV